MPSAQRYIFMVSMDVDADKEALFNEVYDQEHVPNLLKVPGVRAVNCRDVVDAELSRRHNDSNVMCLAADLLGEEHIERMIRTWLATEFEGGRHTRRTEKVTAYEKAHSKPD